MTPALRGENIPRATGAHKAATEPRDGEVRVWCPDCDWTAIRPTYAAASAREAHRIAHRKGWVK